MDSDYITLSRFLSELLPEHIQNGWTIISSACKDTLSPAAFADYLYVYTLLHAYSKHLYAYKSQLKQEQLHDIIGKAADYITATYKWPRSKEAREVDLIQK